MRSCAAYEESIWQAAETGQVSPELAQHLTQCACCRASLQALTNAMRGFLELRAVQAPDPTDAVHARIQRPVWRSRLLPALAGALALLCLTVLLLERRQAVRPPGGGESSTGASDFTEYAKPSSSAPDAYAAQTPHDHRQGEAKASTAPSPPAFRDGGRDAANCPTTGADAARAEAADRRRGTGGSLPAIHRHRSEFLLAVRTTATVRLRPDVLRAGLAVTAGGA